MSISMCVGSASGAVASTLKTEPSSSRCERPIVERSSFR